MAHGGKRPGAGRKPGSATTKTRETANALTEKLVATARLQPLEMMVEVAQQLWDAAIGPDGKIVDRKLAVAAATLAKDAAPYIHPRLTSVEAKLTHDFTRLSDADLAAELAAYRSRALALAGAGSGETEEAPARLN